MRYYKAGHLLYITNNDQCIIYSSYVGTYQIGLKSSQDMLPGPRKIFILVLLMCKEECTAILCILVTNGLNCNNIIIPVLQSMDISKSVNLLTVWKDIIYTTKCK